MQGASREALAAAVERLDVLTGVPGADIAGLADDLAAVASLFGGDVALRRMLTDPARPGDQRADVVTALLDGKIGEDAVALVAGLTRSRWSQPRDLADSVATLAVRADLAIAERDGRLGEVEDELFRLGRILDGNGELASALSVRTSPERRQELFASLLDGKLDQTTYRLAARLVGNPRGKTVANGLVEIAKQAAERRQRLVALVRAAVPLTEEQRDRLGAVLARLYGQNVHLNIDLAPELIGGLSVRVGDEVIDGTVAYRLAEAARRLAA